MSSFESKIPKPVNDVTQSPFADKKPEPLLPDWLEEDKHAAEKDIDKDAAGQQVSNDPLVQHKLEMIRCTEENAKTDPLMQHKLDMIRCTKEKEKTDPLVLHKLEMIRCTKEKEKTDPLVLHKLEMIRCTKEKEKTDPLVLHKLDMIRCTEEKEKTDPVVQMKLAMRNMSTLRVSQPGDSRELEADKKSEEVLGAPLTPEGGIQRLEEDKDTVEDKEELSAKSAGSGGELSVDAETKDYINNLPAGQSLPARIKKFFQARFGRHFNNVKIHTDHKANEAAAAINAKAFTKGNDIVFGKGQYQPDTTDGKKLLAHELTHTLQQGGKEINRAPRDSRFGRGNSIYNKDGIRIEWEKTANGFNIHAHIEVKGDTVKYYYNEAANMFVAKDGTPLKNKKFLNLFKGDLFGKFKQLITRLKRDGSVFDANTQYRPKPTLKVKTLAFLSAISSVLKLYQHYKDTGSLKKAFKRSMEDFIDSNVDPFGVSGERTLRKQERAIEKVRDEYFKDNPFEDFFFDGWKWHDRKGKTYWHKPGRA